MNVEEELMATNDALVAALRGANEEIDRLRGDLKVVFRQRNETLPQIVNLKAQIAARQAERDEAWTQLAQARKERDDAEAQIAAKDAALDALDEAHQITQQNLWQDITELRASLVGKEQEHQDFRLQNDREWRAKLDHLKAQIAAWEQAAGIYFMIDADKAYQHLIAMNEGKRPRPAATARGAE